MRQKTRKLSLMFRRYGRYQARSSIAEASPRWNPLTHVVRLEYRTPSHSSARRAPHRAVSGMCRWLVCICETAVASMAVMNMGTSAAAIEIEEETRCVYRYYIQLYRILTTTATVAAVYKYILSSHHSECWVRLVPAYFSRSWRFSIDNTYILKHRF